MLPDIESEALRMIESLPRPDAIRSQLNTSIHRVRVLRQLLKTSEVAAKRGDLNRGRLEVIAHAR